MKKQSPVRGKRYTFADLCRLELRDSPGLMVNINGRMRPVQNSHVTDKDIIKNCPEFAKSIWEYIKETSEWIPVFHFVGTQQELFRLVDHEPYIDPYSDDAGALWMTPKGSPRQQFYEKEGDQIFESGTKSED